VLLACLSACGAAVPPLPSQGGPPWREIQSARFTLWTDASSARGHELVREMEQRRQVIVRAMRFAPRGRRIFAIALRNERELAAFIPEQASAVAWRDNNPSRQAGLAMHADNPADEQARVLNHELAHAVSYSGFKNQPRWLAEGLATYFENAELMDGASTVQVGVPRRDQAIRLRQVGALPVAKLLACDDMSCVLNDDFYASSWLLFSHLLNSHFDAFARYLKFIQELPADKHLLAWKAAFPDLSVAKLDEELHRLIKTFKVVAPEIEVSKVAAQTTERKLTDADALAARGLLHLVNRRKAAALADATAALAVDQVHLLAWSISSFLDQPPTLAQARAVTAANPNDSRAWLMLLDLLDQGAERDAASARMCHLAALEGEPCR
jgi:Protein of unknown function (DUF1570)